MNLIKNKLIRGFNFGANPYRLDSFRIFFSFLTLFMFWSLPWEYYADIPQCIWSAPGITKYLFSTSLNLKIIMTLRYIFLISILGLALGIFTRVTALLSAVTLYVLLSNSVSAFYYDRSGNQIVVCLFILFMSPTIGSHFSIDRLIFKNRNRKKKEYVWPTRLIQFLFFSTFFTAGISKIVNSGWDWTAGENLIAKWIWAGITFKSNVIFDLQYATHAFMVKQSELASISGPLVLGLEIFSLFFFVSKKNMWVGVLLFALFQISVFFTMYISFSLFIPLYAIFIPWERFFMKIKRIKNRILSV